MFRIYADPGPYIFLHLNPDPDLDPDPWEGGDPNDYFFDNFLVCLEITVFLSSLDLVLLIFLIYIIHYTVYTVVCRAVALYRTANRPIKHSYK